MLSSFSVDRKEHLNKRQVYVLSNTRNSVHRHTILWKEVRTCPICFKQDVRLRWWYGAMCCQYCKAFFKNVLNGRKYVSCEKSLACRIAPGLSGLKRGPLCRLCRFQRCLSKGMRPDLTVNVYEKENKIYISSPDYPDLPPLISIM